MTPHYTPIQQPAGVVKFRRSVVILGLAALLGVISYGILGVGAPASTPQAPAAAPTTLAPKPADVFAQLPQTYRDVPVEEPPPPPPPQEPTPAAATPAPPPAAKPEPPVAPTRPVQTAKPPPPSRHTAWKYLAQQDRDQTRPAKGAPQEERQTQMAGNEIIHPARWAMPSQPLKTIYRSMRMQGRVLDNINSDIPASTIRIALTEPLLDKFRYGTPILETGTVVIAQQVGKAEFGQQRIPLKIEQIEPPSGEVIKVEGGIGGERGAAGVPGHVNAHTGQLLLATAINAVMNLGLGYAVGQPGRGYYYQDPGQQAVQQAGQSVAQDVQSYTRQVLKRPPTIDVDAQKAPVLVTVFLTENIQLNRAPAIAR